MHNNQLANRKERYIAWAKASANWDYEGSTPAPQIYIPEEIDYPAIVYDDEGNPYMQPKIKLGFDLSVKE